LSNGSCPISEFVDYPDTGKSGIEVFGINMSTISLNNNNFIHFIGTSFKSFSNIHRIYMRSNELVFVQADGLQQLKHLDLESNDIFRK
jgi:hypothetical protein